MATRTKKSGQRKALVAGLAAFASVCLIATGFAAWVISAKAEKKENGNINIGVVSNADVKIKVNQDEEDDGILNGVGFSFNPEANDTTGRVRYDGTNKESLKVPVSGTVGPQRFVTSFTIKLDVVKEVTTGDDEDAKTEIKVDEEANNRFKKAETDGFITLPDCFANPVELYNTEAFEKTTPEKDDSLAKFNYEIVFGWGSKFGTINPGRYFDDDEIGSKTSDAEVSKTLNDFYTALTGNAVPTDGKTTLQDASLKFRITLTADTAQTPTK